MAQGIEFTNYVPVSLIGVNSASPTLAAEAVTGLPISTGAFPGNAFYLSEGQANQLSQVPLNNTYIPGGCHAGWYLVVKVDVSAVASNIKAGAIGGQLNIPTTNAASQANIPPQSVVTDGATAATAGMLSANPVVFLGAVTPGNYTIVQIAGDSSVLLAASQTTAVGALLQSQTPGNSIVATTFTQANYPNTVGTAEAVIVTPAAALVLTAVAASSGGTAVYTGTLTGGAANAFVGNSFVVTGFVNAVNNGTFICSASTALVMTLSNPNAIAETHGGTATPVNLVRTNVAFPFGIV